MDFIFGLLIGAVLGGVISVFIVCCRILSQEQEAYREGYEAGMANTKKGNV